MSVERKEGFPPIQDALIARNRDLVLARVTVWPADRARSQEIGVRLCSDHWKRTIVNYHV